MDWWVIFQPQVAAIGWCAMMPADALVSLSQQDLAEGKAAGELEGKTYPVGSTRARTLRTMRFLLTFDMSIDIVFIENL